jgi:GGDEF domain-containing protein
VNVNLYTAIAFVFLVVVCCGSVVVLGRAGDIVSYVFHTDHVTGFRNAAWLDRYLHSLEKKILDAGVVYCSVTVDLRSFMKDQTDRSEGDAYLKMFAAFLKGSFGVTPCEMVHNGGGRFFIFLSDSQYSVAEDIFTLFHHYVEQREEFREVEVRYEIGIAAAAEREIKPRALLSAASAAKTLYISPGIKG